MGHPLRLYEPDVVYEVTTRTLHGRLLLRPSAEANDLIAGVIGRGQELYPDVRIHGVVVLSTHLTWLVSSPVPAAIAAFFGFVNGNISREIGRIHDWPGTMWERRQRPIPVVDEPSMVARFEYLLAQGTKEGLVASPRHWPGVSCVDALRGKRPLRGTWFDRDADYKARRRGRDPGPHDFATTYTVRFDKLPCWADRSDAEYAALVEELIHSIEDQAALARDGRRVLGTKAILRAAPHTRPERLERSPAPMCHASSGRARQSFRDRYGAFVAAFRRAAAELRAGIASAVFPPWCFPPPRPFVISTA